MRYALTIEAIGDNYAYHLRQSLSVRGRLQPSQPFGKREMNYYRFGNSRLRPWVAKIVGTDGRYGLIREFVDAQKDYSQANSTGSRGVFLHYFLEPGIYEINERLTWQKVRRYFARIVDHKTLIEMSKAEVAQCLP